ncbi:MAG: hypothetical protein LUD12_15490 [Lachnospiraceae bacterium]|nr:hypothetical protein [Lachnospiraceae bacterium]
MIRIVQGSGAVESSALLFPRNMVLIGGVVVYIVLLVGTSVLLKRQVTTELFLIVGWTTLMFLELNALFAQGQFTKLTVIALLVITLIFAIVSMICYLLYYLSSSRDRGRRPRHARSAFFCAALPGTWTR